MREWTLRFCIVALAAYSAGYVACAADGEDSTLFDADDDTADGDDDDDDDFDDTECSGGNNQCGIDYDCNPGCDASQEGCQMAIMINDDREANPAESDCAPAIRWHDGLAAVALAHSQDMCDRQFFEHENPDGQDPFDRMSAAGISFFAAGENIAMGTDGAFDVQDLQNQFMNEPQCVANHRGIILSRDLTHVGIGVYHCDDGNMYVTQDFATFDQDAIRDDPHEFCG
ncbi:CAP domain-containing protein [bacterium]|nr:CAP domain-containing protein [bacterium]